MIDFSPWPLKRLCIQNGRLYVRSLRAHKTEIHPEEILRARMSGLGACRRYLVVTTTRGKYAVLALSKEYPRILRFIRERTGLAISDGREDLLAPWRVVLWMVRKIRRNP
ncbi:MAG: hypothetical protein JXR94_12415 [Candidatus Hydrogenedentes bacterium]|nr:hypothetical protein [Candidatus Hydrogenedentota bacterium]